MRRKTNSSNTNPRFAQHVPEMSPAPDRRVAHALRQANCDYQLTPLGDYLVSFQLASNRSHAVFINSRTISAGLRELRCIYACGYASPDPMPSGVMADLLARNADYAIGAWSRNESDHIHVAILSAFIPAGASPEELMATTLWVGQVADAVEEDLTHDDKL